MYRFCVSQLGSARCTNEQNTTETRAEKVYWYKQSMTFYKTNNPRDEGQRRWLCERAEVRLNSLKRGNNSVDLVEH
jgi:hypothetical protein